MSPLSLYYKIPYNLEKSTYRDIYMFSKLFFRNFMMTNKATKFFAIFIVFILQNLVNPAQIYHFVRLQSLMKLYVIFGFLDVCEKIVLTILKDIQNEMKNQKNEQLQKRENTICEIEEKFFYAHTKVFYKNQGFYIFLYYLFTIFHTIVLMVQYTTLHVCVNSHIYVLYTLLITTNFVEVKTTMFRKFSSDGIKVMYDQNTHKRFYTILFLVIIYLFNISENYDNLGIVLLVPIILIYAIKVLADWIKHIFALKLNDLEFVDYRANLNTDFLAGNILFLYLALCLCTVKIKLEQSLLFFIQ